MFWKKNILRGRNLLIRVKRSRRWFRVKVQQNRLDKNKVYTQLRLLCSEKEFMTRIFTNPIAIFKLKINNQGYNTNCYNINNKYSTMPQLSSDPWIWKILRDFKKSKLGLLNKVRKSESDKCFKMQTPILSTALDDSENNLKTLVYNIENMIKCRLNQSSINIINQLKSKESSRTEIRLSEKVRNGECILDGEGNGISQIIEEIEKEEWEGKMSEQKQEDSHKKSKIAKNDEESKQKLLDLQNLHRILVTEPLYSPKNYGPEDTQFNDEYGILKKPPKQVFFRRKKLRIDGRDNRGQKFYTKSMDCSDEKKKKDRQSTQKLTKSARRSKHNESVPKKQEHKEHHKKKSKKVQEIKSSYYKSGRQALEAHSIRKNIQKSKPKKFIF